MICRLYIRTYNCIYTYAKLFVFFSMLGKSRKLASPKDDIKGVGGLRQEDIAMKLQVAVQNTKSLNFESIYNERDRFHLRVAIFFVK